jgi:hypothetical protein
LAWVSDAPAKNVDGTEVPGPVAASLISTCRDEDRADRYNSKDGFIPGKPVGRSMPYQGPDSQGALMYSGSVYTTLVPTDDGPPELELPTKGWMTNITYLGLFTTQDGARDAVEQKVLELLKKDPK